EIRLRLFQPVTHTSRSLRAHLECVPLEVRVMPAQSPLYAIGADAGGQPKVEIYDAGNSGHSTLHAYGPQFTGGVRVAMGDVNGDGRADIVTANGPGYEPRVCVFDGVTHQAFYNFIATDHSYRGGLFVTTGDLDADGKAEIVTATATGTEVRVYRGSDIVSL